MHLMYQAMGEGGAGDAWKPERIDGRYKSENLKYPQRYEKLMMELCRA